MAVETGWTQVTPTWYEIGGSAAVGNGTLAVRYRRDESALHLSFFLKAGSSTTFGSGGWGFSVPFLLPTTAFSSTTWSEWSIAARAWDDSTSRMYSGVGRISSEIPPGAVGAQEFPPIAYFLDFWMGSNVDRTGATTPFTWATDDILAAGGVLEGFAN